MIYYNDYYGETNGDDWDGDDDVGGNSNSGCHGDMYVMVFMAMTRVVVIIMLAVYENGCMSMS